MASDFHAGHRLREARLHRGLSQEALAAALGLSGRAALSRIERTQQAFRLPFAQAAARALSLPVEHFFPGIANVSLPAVPLPEAPSAHKAGPAHKAGREEHEEHEEIVMVGDAMEPEIAEGARVRLARYAAPLSTVPAGGVYLVSVEGRESIVRVQPLRGGRLRLAPANPAYAEEIVDVEAEPGVVAVLGRVVPQDRLASALVRRFFARTEVSGPEQGG